MIPKDGPEEAALEEHLLCCPKCVARAEESDRYVDAIRAGIILGKFDLE
jgi:anti-sigma factor RsiW